jgi:hypothetical protein
MAYSTAEARQRLLDDLARAIDHISVALAALGSAYELLDEHTADRLEEQLFRPLQVAFDAGVEAIGKADRLLAEIQDSMMPVEVGDAELRAGLAETRELVAALPGRARELVRIFGR